MLKANVQERVVDEAWLDDLEDDDLARQGEDNDFVLVASAAGDYNALRDLKAFDKAPTDSVECHEEPRPKDA